MGLNNNHNSNGRGEKSRKYKNVRYFQSKDGIRVEILLSKPRGIPDEKIEKSFSFPELMNLPTPPKVDLPEGFWFENIDLEIPLPNKETVDIRILLKCWRETSIDTEQDFFGIF